ncbi:hypothetical protein C3K47_05665 [Solitalea longa]|uniref:DUF2490 domain-containing protein n=1 Tax=Solitalea longa TaxID=2079460 RepID=A0A2S5A6P1_9SPHI|nr:DUF2490 domain-containing protein [Solitalea longa]POY38012.1 hypothetical protein C3K47_05665 [Solitalea longa]
MRRCSILLIVFILQIGCASAQTQKVVNHNAMSWFSLNNVVKFSDKWAAVADFHNRRQDFMAETNFWFVRFGGGYYIKPNMRVVAGYAHLWLTPAEGLSNWQDENRFYTEFLLNQKLGTVGLTQRLRVEQRWQEKLSNDVKVGMKFTNRVRYLLSATIPVFKGEKAAKLPALCLSDEILLNFGKEVVYNSMDQNRLFIGIKQNITKSLNFDFGYMNVYQQKSSGNVYDSNNTMRLFFYYTLDLKRKAVVLPPPHESGD